MRRSAEPTAIGWVPQSPPPISHGTFRQGAVFCRVRQSWRERSHRNLTPTFIGLLRIMLASLSLQNSSAWVRLFTLLFTTNPWLCRLFPAVIELYENGRAS